ncbi:hypothetical protein [Larkinella rosea]|uniref:Uncharacterized protein n=1 Tax=Larkinella rosea TaxID=2025312 RepID=A0A3P1BUM1_9BACT|nr:hypothetical protein [Larkinella rosea]RRB04586.1 hypothetical protein EHT25_13945 [Larkinella rosea]
MPENEESEKAKDVFRKLIESSATNPLNSGLSQNEFEQYDKEERRTRLLGLTQDIQERKKFAQRIFWMVVMWLFVILGIIVLEGLHLLDIPQAVTIALIGSTTINVTAFFVIVTKYLFPGK